MIQGFRIHFPCQERKTRVFGGLRRSHIYTCIYLKKCGANSQDSQENKNAVLWLYLAEGLEIQCHDRQILQTLK